MEWQEEQRADRIPGSSGASSSSLESLRRGTVATEVYESVERSSTGQRGRLSPRGRWQCSTAQPRGRRSPHVGGCSALVLSGEKRQIERLQIHRDDRSTERTNQMETSVKEIVREKYGQAALRVTTGGSSCCGATAASSLSCDPITSNLYDAAQTTLLPEEAVLASLGCGNPTSLAQLNPGEVVLDLGSGGGIDVLLSAKRVGPTGKAYGLDMTDEMLALANENKRKAGAENV